METETLWPFIPSICHCGLTLIKYFLPELNIISLDFRIPRKNLTYYHIYMATKTQRQLNSQPQDIGLTTQLLSVKLNGTLFLEEEEEEERLRRRKRRREKIFMVASSVWMVEKTNDSHLWSCGTLATLWSTLGQGELFLNPLFVPGWAGIISWEIITQYNVLSPQKSSALPCFVFFLINPSIGSWFSPR